MFSSESSADVNKNSNFLLSNHQQNAGLARYRSAPSSILSALLNNDDHNNSGDEAEALMFSAAFFNGSNGTSSPDNDGHDHSQRQRHQMVSFENAVNCGGGSVVGSYTLGMEGDAHLGMINDKVNNSCNSLARQSSSPAGFLNVMGNQSNFPSNSRTSYMPSIPENGNDGIVAQTSENLRLSNGLKRSRNGYMKIVSNFSSLDIASVENGRRSTSGLVHHLSLPTKNASEMASTAENFLHFQNDSIQTRAKRGCATHPRSIAERMRRTRISEKMKKLQDLFPNLDKQTKTADMLDMAVEYIKQLQNQVQSLTESKAKCVCPNKA